MLGPLAAIDPKINGCPATNPSEECTNPIDPSNTYVRDGAGRGIHAPHDPVGPLLLS